jgi:hypothetical protein
MAEVVVMPGVFRADQEADCEATACLRSAMDAGLRDVVIVGRALNGGIEVWASAADADRAIGLMHRGLSWLTAGEQLPADDDGDSIA